LTGADLYYWFVTGFGDVERLSDSHFAPIDVPIMVAVTSFIVQGYYCYRIWMLNRQLLWFCCIIAVFTVAQSTGALWAAITVSAVHAFTEDVLSYTAFSHSLAQKASTTFPSQLYFYGR
jgi:triacylglycerol esterase/lipase EstA (alpha/beta hydrolase family)